MNILALDLGTSSVRGLVLDADAVPLPGALARRKMAITIGDDGAATLDAAAYLAALGACLDELADGRPPRRHRAGRHRRAVALGAAAGHRRHTRSDRC